MSGKLNWSAGFHFGNLIWHGDSVSFQEEGLLDPGMDVSVNTWVDWDQGTGDGLVLLISQGFGVSAIVMGFSDRDARNGSQQVKSEDGRCQGGQSQQQGPGADSLSG